MDAQLSIFKLLYALIYKWTKKLNAYLILNVLGFTLAYANYTFSNLD